MNFPNSIYADDDLVCGEEQTANCRVRYVKADALKPVVEALKMAKIRKHQYDERDCPLCRELDKALALLGEKV